MNTQNLDRDGMRMRLERTGNGRNVFRNGAFNFEPQQLAMSSFEDTVAGTCV